MIRYVSDSFQNNLATIIRPFSQTFTKQTPHSTVLFKKLIVTQRSSQKIPRISCNPKFHYRIHMSPPLVPIVCQINPVHAPHPVYVKLILVVSFHLHLGLPTGLFPSRFPTKALFFIHATCPVALNPLDSISRIIYV